MDLAGERKFFICIFSLLKIDCFPLLDFLVRLLQLERALDVLLAQVCDKVRFVSRDKIAIELELVGPLVVDLRVPLLLKLLFPHE